MVPRPRQQGVRSSFVPLALGVVTSASTGSRPAGSAEYAMNYEPVVGGGWQRAGSVERFDGRPRPSDATFVLLGGTFSGVALGNTVNGQTSGATGVVCYLAAGRMAVTKVTGTFQPGEVIRFGVTPVGTSSAGEPAIASLENAQVSAAAADVYRNDILAVPGSGPVRGVAVLANVVYAWRDNAGGTAMAIHRSTSSGWQAVDLFIELTFSGGSVAPIEGATITQTAGSSSATVRRVVLESGSWAGGTAAGRLIISNVVNGPFAVGAINSGGTLNVTAGFPGPATQRQIALQPGGRVETEVYGFTGLAGQQRLYGCDGVNQEFEFDGTVYVPINTGMTAVRASYVRCHRNHLFLSYSGSLQHSGPGLPYQWSPVVGAAELGTGDFITGLVSLAGSEVGAALLTVCRNSAWVLYGKSAGSNNDGWTFTQLADRSGGRDRSVVYLGSAVSLDQGGALKWSPTDAFGNFIWESASDDIKPTADGFLPVASVVVRQLGRARWFAADGSMLVASPGPSGRMRWAIGTIGRPINCAINDEINGVSRTFYGGQDGFVYEADVGRSNDGQAIESLLRINPVDQGAPGVLKKYLWAEVEMLASDAMEASVLAEFSDQDPDLPITFDEPVSRAGAGGRWDISLWDRAVWDARSAARTRVPTVGKGYNVSLMIYQSSAISLPHEARAINVGHELLRSTNFSGG